MSIVSNTGPLIALAKADRMDLLPELYGTVHIPPAVHRELLGKTGPEADRLDVALAAWLKVADRVEPASEVESALQAIDAGEREAILLAQRLGLTVILDDRLGSGSAPPGPAGDRHGGRDHRSQAGRTRPSGSTGAGSHTGAGILAIRRAY